MSSIIEKLFGKKESNDTHSASRPHSKEVNTVYPALILEQKRFAQEHPDLAHLDNQTYQMARLSRKGNMAIKATIEFQIRALVDHYPELDGLFEITTNNHDEDSEVIVCCIKGFSEKRTKSVLPTLWRRKMFMENCILLGVTRIAFIDITNNTGEFVEPEKIDYQSF